MQFFILVLIVIAVCISPALAFQVALKTALACIVGFVIFVMLIIIVTDRW